MKINNLMIDGVGGIRNLELSFNEGFNVICGANGVGKTTILNTVADAFSNSGELLKRNSMVDEGTYCIDYFDITGKEVVKGYEVKEFDPKSIYPDLVVAWDNLLPSCPHCNKEKSSHDTGALSFDRPRMNIFITKMIKNKLCEENIKTAP